VTHEWTLAHDSSLLVGHLEREISALDGFTETEIAMELVKAGLHSFINNVISPYTRTDPTSSIISRLVAENVSPQIAFDYINSNSIVVYKFLRHNRMWYSNQKSFAHRL
jgi:predicted DNA binding protein